jgi:hypothetical protein
MCYHLTNLLIYVTKNINGIWVHQNTGLYYQVVAVQPPCEQQQLVKLCYKNYEGHLGKLK